MTHISTLLATAILSLIGFSTAHAQIDPHLGQTVMNKTVTVNVTGTSTIRTVGLGSTFGNDGAARIDITLSYKNQANQTLSVTKVPVFCTDLRQSISVGSTYTNFLALDAVAGVFPLNGTTDRVDANRMLALEYLYGTAFGTTANYFAVVPTWTDYKLAGFQLALWEIVHELSLEVLRLKEVLCLAVQVVEERISVVQHLHRVEFSSLRHVHFVAHQARVAGAVCVKGFAT